MRGLKKLSVIFSVVSVLAVQGAALAAPVQMSRGSDSRIVEAAAASNMPVEKAVRQIPSSHANKSYVSSIAASDIMETDMGYKIPTSHSNKSYKALN